MIPKSFSIESSAPAECGVPINYPSLSHFLRGVGITGGRRKKAAAGPTSRRRASITRREPMLHHRTTGRQGPRTATTLSIRASCLRTFFLGEAHFAGVPSRASLDSWYTVGGSTTLPACPLPAYLLSDKLLPYN